VSERAEYAMRMRMTVTVVVVFMTVVSVVVSGGVTTVVR
jgi:hypothetical protein